MIAPSGSFPKEDVALTRSYFEAQGMKVTIPEDTLGEDLLCANQDSKRLLHLKNALTDPTVGAVMMLRGGYGLTRLIPNLLQLNKPKKEKLFIGFSDGTALHIVLNQKWGWPSVHGPGASQIAKLAVGPGTIGATLRMI
jgi:muramoyltetrapeptide carboxypeptidase